MSTQGQLPFQDSLIAREGPIAVGDPPNQDATEGVDRTLPKWLGIVTSHRRLFEASQDGWMRPPSRSCLLLGRECFVSEELAGGPNLVPTRIKFDVSKLPFPEAWKEFGRRTRGVGGGDQPRVVQWCAPIPLYSVEKLEVSSVEQRARLLGMADQLSNVCLPGLDVAVSDFAEHSPVVGAPERLHTPSLDLPASLNAVQGAMAMAVWAVPRVEPWIELLQQALTRDSTRVREGASRLDAQWLQIPWLAHEQGVPLRRDAIDQGRLWRAALSCMECSTAEHESPSALAEKISHTACLGDSNRTAERWLDETRRLVSAEETIKCDGWRQNGAGLAIQLVLLRPEPMRFKSWSRDLPGLPPAVWWAAATLCGWRHGYRVLDKNFRGDAKLQEFLATRALAVSWPGGEASALPPSQQSPIERIREDGCFALSWRGHPVVRKPWHSRAKWFRADLKDVTVSRAARSLADRLGWPCVERWLSLPEGRVPTVGSGRLSVDGDGLVVEGKRSLRLPEGVNVEERFNSVEFRLRLATEAGVLADPPEVVHHQAVSDPPGLMYKSHFITEEDEAKLVALIDRAEWSTQLQRRVQHYGWRYDYKQRQVSRSDSTPSSFVCAWRPRLASLPIRRRSCITKR